MSEDEVPQAIDLQKMQPQHLEQIAKIHKSINPSHWSLEQWLACCEQPLYQNWVVLNNEADPSIVIAFASFICLGSEVELLNIGVAEDSQGHGIGENLLKACLKLAPEKTENCFLEVRRSNIPAINLYKKLGFQQIAERKQYYRFANGLSEDALVFKKLLQSTV